MRPRSYLSLARGSLFRSRCLASIHSSALRPGPSSSDAPPLTSPSLPSRRENLASLRSTSFDLLVVGGGATGAGTALDAAARGLSVAVIDRGDWGCETSSRSTKLIWAGIRYLATATAGLLKWETLGDPAAALRNFRGEIAMVVSCHRERRYMAERQPHLVHWMPIAVPFRSWTVWPPPLGHPLFSLFPIIAPFAFKLYDSLSSFSCPPSFVMGKAAARKKFPQLAANDGDLKYCGVFYEAMHNDARTNLAIALSASEYGAATANYVSMTALTTDENGVANGIEAEDALTGKKFSIDAQRVVFAGGPFTDGLRGMEGERASADGDAAEVRPAVRAAAGTHVVLPGYYTPPDMGLLDHNTSDGRFLFLLPWLGHTLAGTTDVACPPSSSPSPPEDEVQWILNECGKYLSKDLRVRRSDVSSAWRGWRPLAVDPHAPPGAPASRDHVISEHPGTGVVFVAGGKWTTWREMAEEVVDRICKGRGEERKCTTLDITLHGGKGYTSNLAIKLIQKHGMDHSVAQHLANTYGTKAWDVCELSAPTGRPYPRFGTRIVPDHPYITAEIVHAARFEGACTVEDVVARRTRMAYLDRSAALAAIPVVGKIMAKELGWNETERQLQETLATEIVGTYGGPVPDKAGAQLRAATYRDVVDVFKAIDVDGSGFLDRTEMGQLSVALGFPLTEKEVDLAFVDMDTSRDGRVTMDEFEAWWNRSADTLFHRELAKELGVKLHPKKDLGSGIMLG